MNTCENTETVGLNAADFLGNYLKKEDVNCETVVRLTEVRADIVPGSNRRKLLAQFAEFEKPLILNSTNIKRLSKLFGSANTLHWRGDVTLYVDENVEYAGTPVGGLRVKAAERNGAGAGPARRMGLACQTDEPDIL